MDKRLLLALIISLIFSINNVKATDYYWKGTASNGNWDNPSNWFSIGGSSYPSSNSDNAYIGVNYLITTNEFTGSQQPVVDVSISCATVTIGTSKAATLTLAANLSVNSTISVASGSTITGSTSGVTLSITGNNSTITNNGTISLTNQTITLNGNPSAMTNSGTMTLVSSILLLNQQNTTFTNSGPLTMTSSTANLSGNPCAFTNNSSITVTNAIFNFTQQKVNFINSSGASITGTGGTFTLSGGGTGAGAGNACTITNNGSMALVTGAIALTGQYASFYNTGGSLQINSCPITMSGGSNLFNNSNNTAVTPNTLGTVQANVCNLSITNNNNSYVNNTGGSFIIASSTITMSVNPVGIRNSAIFTANSCNVNSTAQNAGITNSSPGVFTYNSATYTSSGGTNGTGTPSISNASGATFNCTAAIINFTAGQYNNISNAGTFNAGSSTISMGADNNFINNTGTFNLGPTSVINVNFATAYVTNSGTFTLQSSATSSATIGAVTLGGKLSGNFNVQRHFNAQSSGVTADYTRNYRVLSSPVNVNTVYDDHSTPATAYGTLTYLSPVSGSLKGVFTAGPGGTGSGFSVTNATPTLYLYNEKASVSNSSFNGGTFKGITNITGSTLPYYINASGGALGATQATLYAGNGFFLYYCGNNTANVTASATAYNKQTRVNGSYGAVDTAIMTAIGTLNQGAVPVRIWSNANTTLTAGTTGYNLVGNPYASSIDWDQFSTSNTAAGIYGASGVGNTIYIFNYQTKNYGTYQSGTSGGIGTNNASRYIASGQGFFVQTASGGALTFNETAKTNVQPSSLGAQYQFMGLPVSTTAQAQYLRVKVSKDSIDTDDILLLFQSSAKNTYEPYVDGLRLSGTGNISTLASYSTDSTATMLAINHMHSIDSTTRIKLYVNVLASTGTDTLSATGFATLDPRYDVYLLDHYKKDSLLISKYPAYLFNINNSDTSSYGANRFELVFHKKSGLQYRLLSFTAAQVTGGVKLSWQTADEENLTGFQIERADGTKEFISLNALQSNGSGSYSYLDKSPLTGLNLYRLQQDDPFDVISYSSVISVNTNGTGKAPETLSLYPNPVANQFNIIINTNIPAEVTLKVTNVVGQVVINKVMAGGSIQQAVNNLLPGSYVATVTDNSNQKVIGEKKFIKQ